MLKNQLMFSADDVLFVDSSSSFKMDSLDSTAVKFTCNLKNNTFQNITEISILFIAEEIILC